MAKDRHRLAVQKAKRRAVEDRELETREELEEREDRVWFFYCHSFECAGALMEFAAYEAEARGDCGDEEATAWALLLHAHSTRLMVMQARDVWDAEVRILLDTEAQLRTDIQHSDAQLRFELMNTARQCWLQARRAELAKDPAPVSQEDADLAAAILEEFRTLRRQQVEAEAAAAQEAAQAEQRQHEERVETLWALLTSEVEELQKYEAFVRHETAREADDAFASLTAHEEAGLVAATEAFHRNSLQYTRAVVLGDALGRAAANYAATLLAQRQKDLRVLAQDERTEWIKARIRYLERLDGQVQEREERHMRKLQREEEERRRANERILSYTRAEGDDRALLLADERAAWREVLSASNDSLKYATLMDVTRAVERELEESTLQWSQELWDALEGGDMKGRKRVEEEEEALWKDIADEENRAFLRSRGMVLRREKAEYKAAERAAVAAPERPPPAEREPPPAAPTATNAPSCGLRELMGSHDSRREENLAGLKVKWDDELQRAREQRAYEDMQRKLALVDRAKAAHESTRQAMLADEMLLLNGEEMAARHEVHLAWQHAIVAYLEPLNVDHPRPTFFATDDVLPASPPRAAPPPTPTPPTPSQPGTPAPERSAATQTDPLVTPARPAGPRTPLPTPSTGATGASLLECYEVDDDVVLDPGVIATKLRLHRDAEGVKRGIVEGQERRGRAMLRSLYMSELHATPLLHDTK
eukprot:TRINITY_DN24982_c0_g1_i1.p1 TRINITY_DN24982_c0_g1~~TRINITY_DN24982_c0_g1_i1.p1  ORF type:complete len:730 (+),score=327.14 TRINITY_DN24982_c0_g1_i1:67-2190(+)